MKQLSVTVGDIDLDFEVETDDFNQYLNEQMPNDKVAPAYNFLARTVKDESKDALKKIALDDGKPNGIVVLQIAGVLAEQFGAGVQISLKKPKK